MLKQSWNPTEIPGSEGEEKFMSCPPDHISWRRHWPHQGRDLVLYRSVVGIEANGGSWYGKPVNDLVKGFNTLTAGVSG